MTETENPIKPIKKKPILIKPRKSNEYNESVKLPKSKKSSQIHPSRENFTKFLKDEIEWEEMKRNSTNKMIVVEVYFEWAGHCSAMTNYLKKIKVEVDNIIIQWSIHYTLC